MGILIAIHVLVTIFLILIVLIQKNEGGSSLFANSGGNGMFTARGTSNVLTKATWILASIFLLNCIAMAAIDSSHLKTAQSIIEKTDQIDEPATEEVPAEENGTAENAGVTKSESTAEKSDQVERKESKSQEGKTLPAAPKKDNGKK